jgi:MraZ protein
MFYGEFEHSLDEKGRVTIPSAFRDPLGSPAFVTRGPEHCLLVFELGVWTELARKLKRGSISRQSTRVLYAGTEAQVDRHGRVLIPQPLREYAGLELGAPAVIVGVDERLEIWSLERWRALTSSVVDGDNFVRELAELGL